MMYEFDLVVIGAGSGGTRAARFAAANYGAKVAIVELPFGFVSSDTVGGAGGTYVPELVRFHCWICVIGATDV